MRKKSNFSRFHPNLNRKYPHPCGWGLPYVINSHCKAISDPSTVDGEYSIAYGALSNYEVPIFSPVEIGKSTDYKFKDGIICYKASVFTGGNVVGYNGFLRIKKGTTATTEEA